MGGYGRKELNFHSDVDLILLFKKRIPTEAKALAGEVLYPLWDLGLDLGYAVRSTKECLNLCKNDFEVATSFLDARFICGDSPLYLSFMQDLKATIFHKKRDMWLRWLKDRYTIRKETYGDASFLLEPQIKEGIGGLRDYHHMLWISKVFFGLGVPRDLEYLGKLSHSEYAELREALEFIWSVRNHLHQLSGRNNDRLGFEHQEDIAQRLGFKGAEGVMAVEQFMGRLHTAMIAATILDRMGGDPELQEDVIFLIQHHLLLMKTATRRDLGEEKVVVQCARTVGSIHRLKMLYLLSWADAKATGPRAWNDWTANLLLELFFKVLHTLEKGELATVDASETVERTMGETFRMRVHENEAEGCFEMAIICEDRPGLFADIAGVLALNHIDVFAANIYTWRDGTAVDLFKVTPPRDPLRAHEIWERIETDMQRTFTGKLGLTHRLSTEAMPLHQTPPPKRCDLKAF